MKIIISPAKKMNIDDDTIIAEDKPIFEDKAIFLSQYLKTLSYEQLKKLLGCNEKIATLNYNRYQNMDLKSSNTPAILSYEGIQYQYMAPNVFSDTEWSYVNNNLRILSGLYGILKPLDRISPYRLEMQAKLKTDFCDNLYDFWGDSIYNELSNEDIIINLASKEYSKVIEDYLTVRNPVKCDDICTQHKIKYITCIFGILESGKIKMTGTKVKMARGSMVRFMATNNVTNIEKIKEFHDLNYIFSEELSNEAELVFIENQK